MSSQVDPHLAHPDDEPPAPGRYQGFGSWPASARTSKGVLARRPGLWHAMTQVPEGARHTVEWYERPGRVRPGLWPGQRMLIRCEGGPCYSRLDAFPPLLEVSVPGGQYVLVDDGPVHEWWYRFVPGPA